MTEKNKSKSTDLADLSLTETIERLSAVNYSYDEMAIYLGMKKSAFRREANKKDSPIWLAITRGCLNTKFKIEDKLAEKAASGNVTALHIYKKNYDESQFEKYKDLVYGKQL